MNKVKDNLFAISVQDQSSDTSNKQRLRNETLAREIPGCGYVVLFSGLLCFLDVWYQVAVYGMKYVNNGNYPLPQTEIVAIKEMCKLVVFIIVVSVNRELFTMRICWRFCIPPILYAISNNMYLLGLHYTTPPMWTVLIQNRLILTALIYRCFFKRSMNCCQWLALVLLIVGIALTLFTGGQTWPEQRMFLAVVFSLVASVASVLASITMEFMFKNEARSFGEMQVQFYFFGSIAAWLIALCESKGMLVLPSTDVPPKSLALLGMALTLGVAAGTMVAVIMKKLDNIVKLYTQSLVIIMVSIACSFFFPDHFTLNVYYFLSLAVVFGAIIMYETINAKEAAKDLASQSSGKQ